MLSAVCERLKRNELQSVMSAMKEMKSQGELQEMSGVKKSINSELWHACAGPLVSLPQIGNFVYYFPQGHSEQVAFSTKQAANSHIPNYSSLPSQLLCQVHNVTLHADKDTDEIFAQMTLQPVKNEMDVLYASESGGNHSKQPSEHFCKTLTASDTSTHGGFSVPRRAAEKLFPPLDFSVQPPTQELIVRDLHDNTWTFRHIYRGQPKRHLLTTGWSLFISAKRLKAGDSVLFIRDEKGQLLLGVRRANRQQTTLPSSVLSADNMHIGVLAAAAHAAANHSPFTIFYNPRACLSEFVISLAKFQKSVYGIQVSVGMRFGMMFETEESGKRRYVGTIIGISDIDPVRWPNSKWRTLRVEWDEPCCSERQSRVSVWEIQTADNPFFISPSAFSTLKRQYQLGFAGEETDREIYKRLITEASGGGNGAVQHYLVPNSNSEQLMRLIRGPEIRSSGMLTELSQSIAVPTLQCLGEEFLKGVMPSFQFVRSSINGMPLQNEDPQAASMEKQHQLLLQQQSLEAQNQNSSNCVEKSEFVDSSLISVLHIPTREAGADGALHQFSPPNAPSPLGNMTQQVEDVYGKQKHDEHMKNPSYGKTIKVKPSVRAIPIDALEVQSQNDSKNLHQELVNQTLSSNGEDEKMIERLQLVNQSIPQVSLPMLPPLQNEAKAFPQLQLECQNLEANSACQKLQASQPQGSQFQDFEDMMLHSAYFQSLVGIRSQELAMIEPEASILSELDSSDTSVNVLPGNCSGRHDSNIKVESPCILNFNVDASQHFQPTSPELFGLAHQSYLNSFCGASRVVSSKKMGFEGQQETLNLQTVSKCYGLKSIIDEINSHGNLYGNDQFEVSDGSTLLDPFVSGLAIERFNSTPRDDYLCNPSEGFIGDYSSSQDLQSQVTSMGPAESQTFSAQEIPDNFGGLLSCDAAVDENFHKGLLQRGSPPLRTYTKVQKLGSVGRSIDVTRFKDYDELKFEIACMFGLEGKLNDPREFGWKLVYTDYENDVLLVGDDPWDYDAFREFIRCVRCIKILSPSEVQQMSEEGMQLHPSVTNHMQCYE